MQIRCLLTKYLQSHITSIFDYIAIYSNEALYY